MQVDQMQAETAGQLGLATKPIIESACDNALLSKRVHLYGEDPEEDDHLDVVDDKAEELYVDQKYCIDWDDYSVYFRKVRSNELDML